MKKTLGFCVCVILLSSCYFGDNPSGSKKLTKDFELFWFDDPVSQELILSKEDASNYTILVKETVVEAGYNDRFIILKQHPNVAQNIYERLSDYDFDLKAYEIKKLSDTIWLHNHDEIFEHRGKHYHRESFSVNFLPDSLKPYKAVTNYYIVDTKGYKTHSPYYGLYHCKSIQEFYHKRSELGVPDDLEFTIKTQDD